MKKNRENEKTAIVVLAIGNAYARRYERNFRKSHERFARSVGLPLIVITEPVRASEKHPAWQKLLVFEHPSLAGFDRVIVIDADIYIMTGAQNPLHHVPAGHWGAAKNNAYNLPDMAESDLTLYQKCPKTRRPSFLLNTGFFILERSVHQSTLTRIFEEQPEQNCYENGPLSYHLLADFPQGTILPAYFNTVVALYRRAFGKGPLSIIKMARDNGFIHFVGGFGRTNRAILAAVKIINSIKQ